MPRRAGGPRWDIARSPLALDDPGHALRVLGVNHVPDQQAFLVDTTQADAAAAHIEAGFERALERELARLGLEAVFEDGFATAVLRVSSSTHTGTAYLELRHHDPRLRIALAPYRAWVPEAGDR